jgi:threonine dehydrogenase-like Zn-dependent dehydrogenase
VGSLAGQIALARGATVIGNDAQTNAECLASLGAHPVTYQQHLADQICSVAPGGVDAVFDTVGHGALATTAALGHGQTRLASIVQFDYPGTIPVFARLDPADLRVVSDREKSLPTDLTIARSTELRLAVVDLFNLVMSWLRRVRLLERRPAPLPAARSTPSSA